MLNKNYSVLFNKTQLHKYYYFVITSTIVLFSKKTENVTYCALEIHFKIFTNHLFLKNNQ